MKLTKAKQFDRFIAKRLLLGLTIVFLAGCRLVMTTDETGHIVSGSGSSDCDQDSCVIPISGPFTETFTAVAADGYRFVEWAGICALAPTGVCEIKLTALPEAFAEFDGDVELKAVFESSANSRAWYRDDDGDHYGTSLISIMAHEQPEGYVINDADCDDTNDTVHQRAKEIEDGFDNDCDGIVDEGDLYYRDVDGDGWGVSDGAIESFEPVAGYVRFHSDCDDNNADIRPFAKEQFDGVDNDCDDSVDEGLVASVDSVDEGLVARRELSGENLTNVGPLPVSATDLAEGTRFASPSGSGDVCTESVPCSAHTAIEGARAGDVVFLRGGTYHLDRSMLFKGVGVSESPITIESYPGELAIFDGSEHPYGTKIQLYLSGTYYALRRIEIRNAPWGPGLAVVGSHNLIEGLHSHHNYGPGIQMEGGSFNVIRSSTFNDNSGAGIFDAVSNNGGNADGISISSGDQNRVEHCAAYRNSDDGIDTWRSTNTYVGYSIVAQNGLADGNGNGFKAGGPAPGRATLVEHSISYQNRAHGFDANGGMDVRFRYNTSWSNGGSGYTTFDSTITTASISSDDANTHRSYGLFKDNSWQRSGAVEFVSVDPASPSFLVPVPGSALADIGAFGGQ